MEFQDSLQYRCSYRAKDGKLVHIWSDPYEPWLEDFDNAVICPGVWVQGNAWLLADLSSLRQDVSKLPRQRHRREREDRETHSRWSLTGVS